MEQCVSLITLGVSEYARAKAFYEALGWAPSLDIEETAFFQANGVILVLWGPAAGDVKDLGRPPPEASRCPVS